MRTVTSSARFLRPRKLTDALRMLREEQCVPIAGCTDVFVELQFGLRGAAETFIDLSALDELRGIRRRGDLLDIGALTTYSMLQHSRDVHERLPILAAASREIGGVQIQNRGTIGGNVGNGSPAGDTLPVLAVAEAIVVLRNASEERRVPFNEFYAGYRQNVRRPDELIVAIEIPRVNGKKWFRKVGTRAAQAISKIVAAGVRDGWARFALGSVAPTVVRLPQTEAVLASGGIEQAQQVLSTEIKPIDDIRSNAAYRMKVAQNLLAQFWHDTDQK